MLTTLCAVSVPVILAALIGCQSEVEKAASRAPHYWSQWGGDPRHTGRSKFTGPESLTVRWIRDPDSEDVSPAGGDMLISRSGDIYTALEKWIYEDPSNPEDLPSVRVHVILAMDQNGSKLWCKGPFEASMFDYYLALDKHGNLYYYTRGILRAFSPKGQELWQHESEFPRIGPVATNYGLIYMAEASGQDPLVWQQGQIDEMVLYRQNGSIKRRFPISTLPGQHLPSIDSAGRIMLGMHDYKLMVYDDNGMELVLWDPGYPFSNIDTESLPDYVLGCAKWEWINYWGHLASSPAIMDDGRILLSFDYGMVFHISPTGATLGMTQIPCFSGFRELPDARSGLPANAIFLELYQGLESKAIVSAPDTGLWLIAQDYKAKLLLATPEDGYMGVPLIDAVGNIYVSPQMGELVVLTENGQLLARFQSEYEESFYSRPVIGADGVLYAMSGAGRLYAFEP